MSLMSEKDVDCVEPIEKYLGRQLELRPTVEQDAIKLLSKTTKARQKAELLLSEIGFDDKLVEHKKARRKFRKSQSGRAAARCQRA